MRLAAGRRPASCGASAGTTISRGPDMPPLELAGKYLVVLERTGGEWKIAYLIFNGDQPIPGAPRMRVPSPWDGPQGSMGGSPA